MTMHLHIRPLPLGRFVYCLHPAPSADWRGWPHVSQSFDTLHDCLQDADVNLCHYMSSVLLTLEGQTLGVWPLSQLVAQAPLWQAMVGAHDGGTCSDCKAHCVHRSTGGTPVRAITRL